MTTSTALQDAAQAARDLLTDMPIPDGYYRAVSEVISKLDAALAQQPAASAEPSEQQIAVAVELAGLPPLIAMDGGAVYNIMPGVVRAVRYLWAQPAA